MTKRINKSSKHEVLHPEKRVSTGAYSAAVCLDGWLFISGQGPLDMTTGKVVEGTIEDQTRMTLSHIGKILEAAGCTFDDVVRCGCYISDIHNFDKFNRAYADFFSGVKPARTTVQAVLSHGMKIEIDAIARARDK